MENQKKPKGFYTLEEVFEQRKKNYEKFKRERLNTDDLQPTPLDREKAKFMVMIIASNMDDTKDWEFDADKRIDPESGNEIPFTLRVLRKRIVGEKLKIRITQKAYFLIFLWADTPGKAIFFLHKASNFFEKRKTTEWLVTSDIITMDLFSHGFPSKRSFDKWWDGQKIPGAVGSDNRVDIFPDEWKK
jgi:hypothetical protein